MESCNPKVCVNLWIKSDLTFGHQRRIKILTGVLTSQQEDFLAVILLEVQEVCRVESPVHALPVARDPALVKRAVLRRGYHEGLYGTLHRSLDFCCLEKIA